MMWRSGPTGRLSAGSSDLELTEDGGRQTVGVRFTGVGVPAGARIVAAWVQFTVDERTTTAAGLQIRAVAEGNPAVFAGRYGVTLRPLTQAAVAWSPPVWDSVGAAGAGQRTPDLAGVLQEVVGRADWTAGNSLALVFSGSGKRVAEAYEGSRSAAPLLHIDYQAGSGPVNQPPQVTAAAVPAVTTAPGSVTLQGTISDDGLPNPPATVTVTWAQTQGPATATINNPNTTQTTAYLPQPGNYTFQLTATDGQATTQTTTTATATPPGPTFSTLEVRVGVGGDDVEERADGRLSAGSSDLELTEDGGRQTVGVRFTGVGVPAGARIVAAWVQFTVDERTTTAAGLQIRAVAEGNPAVFAGRYGVTLRPLTQAAVAWSPPVWDSVGAAGAGQRTPDLAGVLQEVVGRADWTAGNSLALVFSGSGKRVAEAYEGSRSAAPLLHIDYQAGSGPVNQPPRVTAAAVPAVTTAPGSVTLQGTISDDGLPNPPATVTVTWAQTQGPATATINNPNTTQTTAYLPQPGTYTFQLTATDGQATTQTTTTATATSGTGSPTIRFAAFGDYGVGNAAEAAVASLVASLQVDFIVTAGDNIQWPGTYDRLVGAYYSAFIGAYQGAYGAGSPGNRFFPALGNHDHTDGGGGGGVLRLLHPARGRLRLDLGHGALLRLRLGPGAVLPPRRLHPDLGAAALAGSRPGRLDRALADRGAALPALLLRRRGSSDWMQWPYEAWGADAVLSGHTHQYERMMRDDNGDTIAIPYIVTGLGGAELRAFDSPVAGSAARYNAGHGTLVVEACDAGMNLAFHSVSHGVVDEYRVGAVCPPRG